MQRVAAQSGFCPEQFRDAVEAQGESYVLIRESMREELAIGRVQQGNVMRNINLSEREIDNFMATDEGIALTQPEYQVTQALLEFRKGDTDAEMAAKEAYVDGVLASILAGRPFEEAVSGLDPYAFKGGSLGWRKLGDIPSMFAEIVPTLERGETGKVKSGSGFHLIYLEDVRDEQLVAQTEVRHILIKPSEVLTNEAARQQVAELRERIIAGEDFSLLAKEFSDDIGTAAEGGELGWTNPGEMVAEFESAMAQADIGVLTEPVETEFGWHILKLPIDAKRTFPMKCAAIRWPGISGSRSIRRR